MSERFENRRIRALVTALLLASITPALAQIERQHGAHVHGTSIVDIALDGRTLAIHLDAPGANLLGFEHAPRDAAERATVAAVLKDLKAPSLWLQPATAAACGLIDAKVASKGLDNDTPATTAAADNHDAGNAETHADFDADYTFECSQPDKLDTIDIQLVKRYAGTKIITLNIASPAGQSSVELSGTTTQAIFPR